MLGQFFEEWTTPHKDVVEWVVIIKDSGNDNMIMSSHIYPDNQTGSPWLRLRQFLKDNPTHHIHKFGIHLNDHYEWLPEDRSAYLFSNGIMKTLNGGSLEYKILGYEEGGSIYCIWFSVQDLTKIKIEYRALNKDSLNTIVKGIYGSQEGLRQ